MQSLDLESVCFITDNDGQRQAAVLPIRLYHQLLALRSMLPEYDPANQTLFHFNAKGLSASGYPHGAPEKPLFTVMKGSQACGNEVTSLRPGILKLRQEMIDSGVLARNGEHFEFQQDQEFNSASMAATLIAGNPRSGMDAWLTEQGSSLKCCGYGKESD